MTVVLQSDQTCISGEPGNREAQTSQIPKSDSREPSRGEGPSDASSEAAKT